MKFPNKKDIHAFIGQFIKFGIVGVSNTIINLLVYYILLRLGFHYIIANTGGFIVSVLNAYYWNRKFVFKTDTTDSKKIFREFIKVALAYGSTFLLSTFLMVFWVELLNISEKIAPILNLLITIPLNFFLNKYWAMR